MVGEFLNSIGSLMSGDTGPLSSQAMLLPYVCSVVGALVLGRFTGDLGNLTLPINCAALFLGAMGATWLLQGLNLPMDQSLHQPLLVSLSGMLIGAFAMIWWLRGNSAPA